MADEQLDKENEWKKALDELEKTGKRLKGKSAVSSIAGASIIRTQYGSNKQRKALVRGE